MKKLRDWYSSLGITVKYVFTIILIVIPFIIGAAFTSSKNDDMDYYGVSFNIVQAQRMRTYLISNYVQQLYTAELEGNTVLIVNAQYILDDQLPIYEQHILALKDGDDDLLLPSATNTEIIHQLDIIIPLIEEYIINADKVIEDPTDITSRDYVIDNALLIDQQLYELTILYENIYHTGYEQLSIVSVMIVLVTVVILGGSLFLLKVLRKNEYYAKYDILTKVRSRSLIFDDIKKLNAEDYTVVYLDIKGFKKINDVYGNKIGDDILVLFAERLEKICTLGYVYRFAGDEFIILLEGKDRSDYYMFNIDHFKSVLLEPFIDNKGREHILSISMGIVKNNVGLTDFEKKINLAIDLRYDSANYKLKPMICDTIEKTQNRINLKNSIATAIENDEIVAYFHPLFTRDGNLKGFESLARWHKDDKVINPGAFIPLINRNGMGFELDMKMIELVGRAFNHLYNAVDDIKPYISINLAIDTINNVQIKELIKKLDTITPIREKIILEILEDVVIGDKTRAKLAELKKVGYIIAFDDFTTGATSFEYLKLKEVDYVKIDKQVLTNIASSDTSKDMLLELIKMIHTSDKQVIIEGVETKEELEIVLDLNVDIIQGFYYAKPMPLDDALNFIKNLN